MAALRSLLALLCLAAAAHAPAADTALEKRAAALEGYWFASARDAGAARVLRITNVVFADAAGAFLAGQYGAAGAPAWPEAREITARLEGGRLVVDVLAAAGERLALVSTPGGLASRDGAPRFRRITLEELRRFVATHPAPEARAGAHSVIELVYVGANDCGLCRRWEATHLGGGKLVRSPDWPHVRFSEVKLPTLSAELTREDLPERLRPRFDALLAAGLRVHGVPSFVLFVDDTFRAHGLGPGAFDSFVLLALRSAVREKLGKS